MQDQKTSKVPFDRREYFGYAPLVHRRHGQVRLHLLDLLLQRLTFVSNHKAFQIIWVVIYRAFRAVLAANEAGPGAADNRSLNCYLKITK